MKSLLGFSLMEECSRLLLCAILFTCCLHISKKTLNIADEIR
ncbi:hypothetical protein HMPREF0971_01517 [Segatella oris F0302]|uniref:Uncharacterized protein n=1 Tax=Segatella oris F0302 TaxID=649760 RepID=D1QRB3_9BACT|nr:hypothetical protein HMPREF0971_01517 [Segatella oris F0302]